MGFIIIVVCESTYLIHSCDVISTISNRPGPSQQNYTVLKLLAMAKINSDTEGKVSEIFPIILAVYIYMYVINSDIISYSH